MWNEIPMKKDYKESFYHKMITQETRHISYSYILGLELQIHTGGRICYGMLCSKVQPLDKQNTVKLSIAFTQQNTVKYKRSILLDDRYVYKGLPEEFLEKVSNCICEKIKEKREFPQCEIEIMYAANCEVGSSSMFFGIISNILIDLIYKSSLDELSSISVEDFKQKYLEEIAFYINVERYD